MPSRVPSAVASRALATTLVLGCGSLACDESTDKGASMTTQTAEAAAKTGTDLETLEKAVTLPRKPQSVRWRSSPRGIPGGLGPTDTQLLAVLEYSAADAQALQASLKPTRLTSRVEDGGWLPAATHEALKGATAYDATPFHKGALRQGTVFHLPQSHTFVLVLFTT
jgi:hypothetical protein